MSLNYSVSSVRAQFPALRGRGSLFDGPGGTQVPSRVADAIHAALLASVSQRSRENYSGIAADRIVTGARAAAAALLHTTPDAVVFGRSATQLSFDIATALGRELKPGDEVLVSRLDHDSNIRPWLIAAEAAGASVKWVEFDKATGNLSPQDVAAKLSSRTKIVAITAASNLFGTRTDIRSIASLVHRQGALLYVDAVAYSAHHLVDLRRWGADFVVCSAYKFCGPHIGILGSNRKMLERLRPNKIRPSTDAVPERFELGTLPYELLAGVSEAVEFLADLVPTNGTLRERLERSYTALDEYESELFATLLHGLDRLPRVRRIGGPERQIPTAIFQVEGMSAAEVGLRLGERDIAVSTGTFYAIEAAERAGFAEEGVVRVGIAPYTSFDDVGELLVALEAIVSG